MKKKQSARLKARAQDAVALTQRTREAYLAMDLDPKRTTGGLGYVVHEAGAGDPARKNRVAEVHYVGLLASSGEVFDESFSRGKAITFRLGAGEVIGGWDIGIGLLNEGDRATLFLPPQLGYGSGGTEGIPPDSELIFYVELVSIR